VDPARRGGDARRPVDQPRIESVEQAPELCGRLDHGHVIELVQPESIHGQVVDTPHLEQEQARPLRPEPVEVQWREPSGDQDQDHESHEGEREYGAPGRHARLRGDDRRQKPLKPRPLHPARQHPEGESDRHDGGEGKQWLGHRPRRPVGAVARPVPMFPVGVFVKGHPDQSPRGERAGEHRQRPESQQDGKAAPEGAAEDLALPPAGEERKDHQPHRAHQEQPVHDRDGFFGRARLVDVRPAV